MRQSRTSGSVGGPGEQSPGPTRPATPRRLGGVESLPRAGSLLQRPLGPADRVVDPDPARQRAVPEIGEVPVALEAGEEHVGPRRVEAGRGRAVAEREERLPHARLARAIQPDGAVVLESADEAAQRRRRVDRDVVELQGLQAPVEEIQPPRNRGQRHPALRRRGPEELHAAARIADEGAVVPDDAAVRPDKRDVRVPRMKHNRAHVHVARVPGILCVVAEPREALAAVGRSHRRLAEVRRLHTADDHGGLAGHDRHHRNAVGFGLRGQLFVAKDLQVDKPRGQQQEGQQHEVRYRPQQPLSEAEQALSRLKPRCEGVVVLGCAYGAMLGVELARQNAAAVQALILVEPRAWLPSIPGRIATALAGRMPQVWLARLATLAQAAMARCSPQPDVTIGATIPAHGLINEIALLLDSSHSALSSVKQPVLLIHRQAAKRAGLDSSILLQRQLGGRVESILVDESGHAGAGERLADGIAERSQRFVATVFEDIETRRGNELRRQRIATRSDAA